MPMYEYACNECGSHVEVRQRMSEDPLTTCPRCDTNALERLVSQSSFALKGGGWYADGYGSKGEKKATADAKNPDAKKPAEKKAEPGKAPEKKADSSPKPDASPSDKSAAA